MSFYRFQAAGKPPGFSRRRGSGRSNNSGNNQHGFENPTWNAASNYLDQQGRPPKARKGKYQSHWESFRQPAFCTCSSIYFGPTPVSGPLPFRPISQDIPTPDGGQWLQPMCELVDVLGPSFTATMDLRDEFLPLDHHTQDEQPTTEKLEEQKRTSLNSSQSSQGENREYLSAKFEEPDEPIEDSTPAQSPKAGPSSADRPTKRRSSARNGHKAHTI